MMPKKYIQALILHLFQHFDLDIFGCGDIRQGEDRNLIETCIGVSYLCGCETIKKVSPIIAEASTNLMY